MTYSHLWHPQWAEVRSSGHKSFANFANGFAWFLGERIFLSVICRDVFHLCGCTLLPRGDSSIYSSIIETKDVQRLTKKVGSINSCLLSCHFYYICETCKHCVLQQIKNLQVYWSHWWSLMGIFGNINFCASESFWI